MIYKNGRRDLLDRLKKQLIGPASGENLLRGSPLDRYPTGILFPIMRDEEGIDPASVSEDDDDTKSLSPAMLRFCHLILSEIPALPCCQKESGMRS